MKIVKQKVELVWITPNPEKMIEAAGRTCYRSENSITEDSASSFTKNMFKSGHGAMIEHAVASFRITTDRAIANEIVRHRIASFAQQSSRYCNFSKDKFGNEISIIEPPGLNDIQRTNWKIGSAYAEVSYFDMIKSGCSAEIARSVLPLCLKTELVMTANFREWLHFINLRGAKAAHPQIRPIAYQISNILNGYSSIFEKYDMSSYIDYFEI